MSRKHALHDYIQHKLNCLHLYCRLHDFHIPRSIAKFLMIRYEKYIEKYIYSGHSKRKEKTP